MKNTLKYISVLLWLTFLPLKGISDERLYVLNRATFPSYRTAIVEFQWMHGTRYSPPQWGKGKEMWVFSHYSLLKWLSIGGGTGYNFESGKFGLKLEIGTSLWKNEKNAVSLLLFGMRETTNIFVAGVGAFISHNFNEKLNLSFNTFIEKAFSPLRDPVDWHLSAGFSYRINNTVQIGVEYLGEDLEDIWEKEEKEGGANNLFGSFLSISFKNRAGIVLEPMISVGPRPDTRNTFLFSSRIWLRL